MVARPAKRQRLEADRRRDMLRGVQNKFADIDFTRYQFLPEAGTAGPGRGRIVPVKPVPTALVENWRHLESYECDGDTSYSEDQFTMLQVRSGHHRRHYTGPSGCTVQSNVPGPGPLAAMSIATTTTLPSGHSTSQPTRECTVERFGVRIALDLVYGRTCEMQQKVHGRERVQDT